MRDNLSDFIRSMPLTIRQEMVRLLLAYVLSRSSSGDIEEETQLIIDHIYLEPRFGRPGPMLCVVAILDMIIPAMAKHVASSRDLLQKAAIMPQ